MSDEIKSALTPSEWAEFLAGSESDAVDETERTMRINRLRRSMADAALNARRYDAAAALVLYGQRFGFTWNDVDALGTMAFVAEGMGFEPVNGYDGVRHFRDLADRIAALLPPRS